MSKKIIVSIFRGFKFFSFHHTFLPKIDMHGILGKSTDFVKRDPWYSYRIGIYGLRYQNIKDSHSKSWNATVGSQLSRWSWLLLTSLILFISFYFTPLSYNAYSRLYLISLELLTYSYNKTSISIWITFRNQNRTQPSMNYAYIQYF